MADQPLNTPTPDPASVAGPVLQTLAGPPQPAPTPSGRRKESVISAEAPTQSPELPGQPAEVEPNPESSPEMDKFVERVEQHAVKPPAETVVVQDQVAPPPKTVSQPVLVLPATEKIIAKGRTKNPSFSVRWLAEWCLRQIRKFKDVLVVYRENS